jgi:hypothetical protein
LDFETLLGDLLDTEKDAIAVEWAEGDGLEDEHVESTWQKVELFLHWATSPRSTRNVWPALLGCQGKKRRSPGSIVHREI